MSKVTKPILEKLAEINATLKKQNEVTTTPKTAQIHFMENTSF